MRSQSRRSTGVMWSSRAVAVAALALAACGRVPPRAFELPGVTVALPSGTVVGSLPSSWVDDRVKLQADVGGYVQLAWHPATGDDGVDGGVAEATRLAAPSSRVGPPVPVTVGGHAGATMEWHLDGRIDGHVTGWVCDVDHRNFTLITVGRADALRDEIVRSVACHTWPPERRPVEAPDLPAFDPPAGFTKVAPPAERPQVVVWSSGPETLILMPAQRGDAHEEVLRATLAAASTTPPRTTTATTAAGATRTVLASRVTEDGATLGFAATTWTCPGRAGFYMALYQSDDPEAPHAAAVLALPRCP